MCLCVSTFFRGPFTKISIGKRDPDLRTRLRFLGNLKLNLWDCGGMLFSGRVVQWESRWHKLSKFPGKSQDSCPLVEAKISSWRTISNLSVSTSSSIARRTWRGGILWTRFDTSRFDRVYTDRSPFPRVAFNMVLCSPG